MKTTIKIVTLILVFGIGTYLPLSAQPPEVTNTKAQMEKLAVSHTESFTVNAPIEEVFKFIVAEDVLPKILKRYRIIPAVTGSTIHKGDWETPGSYRTVHFANGTTLREELNNFDRPDFFAYTVSDFSGFQRRLTTHGRGEWMFDEIDDVTHVSWTYTFHARNRVKRPIVRLFVRTDFKTYMRRSIELIKKQIEHEE